MYGDSILSHVMGRLQLLGPSRETRAPVIRVGEDSKQGASTERSPLSHRDCLALFGQELSEFVYKWFPQSEYTMIDIAAYFGYHRAQLYKVFTGKLKRGPSRDKILQLCERLELRVLRVGDQPDEVAYRLLEIKEARERWLKYLGHARFQNAQVIFEDSQE